MNEKYKVNTDNKESLFKTKEFVSLRNKVDEIYKSVLQGAEFTEDFKKTCNLYNNRIEELIKIESLRLIENWIINKSKTFVEELKPQELAIIFKYLETKDK